MINFLKNLFGLSLRSKVMKAVNKKINEAEKALNEDLKNLALYKEEAVRRAVAVYREEIASAKYSHKYKSEEVTEKHINSILSKIL